MKESVLHRLSARAHQRTNGPSGILLRQSHRVLFEPNRYLIRRASQQDLIPSGINSWTSRFWPKIAPKGINPPFFDCGTTNFVTTRSRSAFGSCDVILYRSYGNSSRAVTTELSRFSLSLRRAMRPQKRKSICSSGLDSSVSGEWYGLIGKDPVPDGRSTCLSDYLARSSLRIVPSNSCRREMSQASPPNRATE